MNKNKIIYGLLSALVGYIAFILMIDFVTKPINTRLSFKPIDHLESYFFGFVWSMGNIGWVIGSVLLIGGLALFFLLGTWVYKKRHLNIKQ